MTRTILLAAAAALLVAGCNKRDETIVNDPMAANDVVDLQAGEGNAPAEEMANEPAMANEANAAAGEANAMGNAASAGATSNQAGNSSY